MRDMGIEDTMEPMLAVYLEEAPQCLARLNRAMAEEKIAAIESAAHAMKSVSGSIKADALADLLRQMEEAARTGDLDRTTGLLDEVRREYHAVVACLQRVTRIDGPTESRSVSVAMSHFLSRGQQQQVSVGQQGGGPAAKAPRRAAGRTKRPHWLVQVARDARLPHADVLQLPPDTPTSDAWTRVSRSCGVGKDDLARHVPAKFRLHVADLRAAEPRAARLLPASLARTFQVFPLREDNRHLCVATADPANLNIEDAIGFASGRTPIMEVAPSTAIAEAIGRQYSPDRAVEELLQHVEEEVQELVRLSDATSTAQGTAVDVDGGSVVKLTNHILLDAVRQGASDIHMQPGASGAAVRFRVDGVLRHYMQLPGPALDRVVSRIKVLGRIDIANRLRPQDGRANLAVGNRTLDLRVSTVPTRDSEKAVIRLLDPADTPGLDALGMTAPELRRFRRLLTHREGIVVVTGPTGSGKTTTLYAALRELSTDGVNIMTVEDPVEYELPGMTQVQVESKREVTFASALRALLRQDPDIVFVGEIRDLETAEVAVRASLTGHLVLTTLHTNNAVGAVRRLTDLGLDRSAISDTFRGAVGQRLVRRVCSHCALPIDGDWSDEERRVGAAYGVLPTVRAIGCDECGRSGHRGRIPLVEVLVMDAAMGELIAEGASASRLHALAVASGMRPLRELARDRVRHGETTLAELDRVLGDGELPQARRAGDDTAHVTSSAARETGPPMGQPCREADAQSIDAEPVHILLVDDDGANRTMARALLERAGYRVSEAADGAAALDLLKNGDQNLMVLDLDMPVLSGQNVLAQVRSSVTTAGLPIIVLTGSSDSVTEIHMMEQGADDYIRKPIDPPRFVARVKAALRRAGG